MARQTLMYGTKTPNALPVVALTFKLLPRMMGVATVWLPPLSLIVAVPVARLASVNVLAPDALIL